jgi:hypothetical protein
MAPKGMSHYRGLERRINRLEAHLGCPRHRCRLVCPGCEWSYLDRLSAEAESVLLTFAQKASVRPIPDIVLEELAHGPACGRCGEYPLICEPCLDGLTEYDLSRLSNEEVAVIEALLEPIMGHRRPIE